MIDSNESEVLKLENFSYHVREASIGSLLIGRLPRVQSLLLLERVVGEGRLGPIPRLRLVLNVHLVWNGVWRWSSGKSLQQGETLWIATTPQETLFILPSGLGTPEKLS